MADSKITDLSVASSLAGSELFYGLEGTTDVKISPAQFAQYIIESFSFSTSTSNVNTIAGAINNIIATGTDTNALLQRMHPVGSLYWSNKNTSPASLFGGTWTQIKDKFILAAGDTYVAGQSSGAETVALTVSEMPSHNHGGVTGKPNTNTSGESGSASTGSGDSHTHSIVSLSGTVGTSGAHTHRLSKSGTSTTAGGEGGRYILITPYGSITSSENGAHTHSVTTSSGTTGNNSGTHTHTMAHTHTMSNHTHSITANGSGAAHNNMPPYIAKYCWERTA